MTLSEKVLRSISCLVLAFSTWWYFPSLLNAQSTISAPTAEDADKVDARAFAVLFRRVDTFEKMAKLADQAGQQKPHLRRNISVRFHLSPGDSETLLRFATAWTADTTAIHTQGTQVIANFHKGFPGGVVRKGMDTSPPAQLGVLQAQLDSVTLRYRDLLRTSMQESEFQRVQLQVRETFGGVLLTKRGEVTR
jgi:hypothetical protein